MREDNQNSVKKTRVRHNESGSIIVWIFIAVILFAALGFAFNSSNRTSTSLIENQVSEARESEGQAYVYELNSAVKRLELGGCDPEEISYEQSPFDGSNGPVNPLSPSNFRCHVFHANGGSIIPKDFSEGCPESVLSVLNVGQQCGTLVYTGSYNGNRMYTTLNDHGSHRWAQSQTVSIPGAQTENGKVNTDVLVASTDADSPYDAAIACRSLGPEWYLPSRNEYLVLYANSNEGVLSGTYATSRYWTSTQNGTGNARWIRFTDGFQSWTSKSISNRIRCVRN